LAQAGIEPPFVYDLGGSHHLSTTPR